MYIQKLFNKNIIRRTFIQSVSGYKHCHNEKVENQTERKQTHFGFQTVDENEKTEKVYDVFEKVADSYDIMNDAMSVGIHRLWKDIFIQRLGPTHGTKLIDVAGGTGDIAFRFIKYLNSLPKPQTSVESSVTICDINNAMLGVGKKRAEKEGLTRDGNINWLQGNAESLPIEDNTYCAYTIAFGVRNITKVDKALSEAYRILRPGGRFLCLEFSHLNNEPMQWAYDQYSFQVIPVLGQLITGQWQPYQYLVESIKKFPNQEEFKHMIENAGFRCVTYENLSFGICAIHSGFKL